LSPGSTTILECYRKEACNSVYNYNTTYLNMSENFSGVTCHPNHEGNLCFSCKAGFGKVTTGSLCESCSDSGMLGYFKFFIVIAVLFLYTLYYVNLYTKVIVSNNIEKRIMLKIIVNHLQQIGIVAVVDMGFSIDFKMFFSIQNYLSFFTGDILSSECLMASFGGDLKLSKTIFALILPVILSFVFVIVWLTATVVNEKLKKNGILKLSRFILRVRLYILICFYMLYPQLISSSLSLMNCMILDETLDIKGLKDSPDILCWDNTHTDYVKIYNF
jgi:cytochrome bd-type quinol oxidase subunit 2